MPPARLHSEVVNHGRWAKTIAFIKESQCATILDVGAGCGCLGLKLKEQLPAIEYKAIDIRLENVEYMKAAGLDATCWEAEHLPFDDKSFDMVVMTELLEHLPNPGTALAEAFRVGKRVLIGVPKNHTDEWHQWLINWESYESGIVMEWKPNQ